MFDCCYIFFVTKFLFQMGSTSITSVCRVGIDGRKVLFFIALTSTTPRIVSTTVKSPRDVRIGPSTTMTMKSRRRAATSTISRPRRSPFCRTGDGGRESELAASDDDTAVQKDDDYLTV